MTTSVDALVDEICRRAVDVPGDVGDVVATELDRLAPLTDDVRRSQILSRAVARLAGLDALQLHLSDPSVDEVMVNAGSDVWVDRRGTLERVDRLGPAVIDVVLERILAPSGMRLDRTNPIVDTRLPDGSRVCAVVDPIAVDGTTVAIRRHRPGQFALSAFADGPTLSMLLDVVRARANTLVTGATSAGKTSLLAALIASVHDSERIVLVEDTTELAAAGHHVVRLEARRQGIEGHGEIDLAHLVRTALRLRPNRLVVGEFRGDEVLAMVQALNTGHDGSMATCHANSALDGLRRAETLIIQAAPSWPLEAVRRHLTRSIDVVVHVERRDDRRQVTEIVEVVESGDEPAGRPLVVDGETAGRLERRRR